MAKITDFLLLALQAWANAITHFLYFRIMGRNIILNATVLCTNQLTYRGKILTTYSRCCHGKLCQELEGRPQTRQEIGHVRE